MKSIQLTKILLFGFISLSLVSCSSQDERLYGCASITTNPSIPLQDLLTAPKSIEIEGNKVSLQMELNLARNLAPSLFPKNQPCLNGAIRIITDKNINLPSSYKVERFWLIDGKEVWETDSILKGTEGGLVIDGGPRWVNPFEVVVIKIINNTGKSFLLKAESLDISNVI